MELEIRKVLELRRVERKEKSRLYSLLSEYVKELRLLIGADANPPSASVLFNLEDYFQDESVHSAYFLQHEGEVAGFVLVRLVPLNELIGKGGSGKILLVDEMYLTPLHRGEGYSQFVLESLLQEAERKRVPLVWHCPVADKVMNRLFARFGNWAFRHKGFNFRVSEVELNGIPHKRYVISLLPIEL